MEYIPQIITIIIGIVLLYFNAYIKKRADNIATKQDIKEITEKIETVKAKLQISTKGIIDFKTDQRQALLNFYDSFVYWYDVVLDLANNSLDEEHLKELKTYDNKIDESYSKLIIQERRLDLYLTEDKKLLQLTSEMISLGVKIEGLVKKFLGTVYYEYEDLNKYYSIWESGHKVSEREVNEINGKIEKLENDLYEKEGIIRKEIDEKLTHFLIMANKYIKIDL